LPLARSRCNGLMAAWAILVGGIDMAMIALMLMLL
jgi:hypothetical protein